MTRGAGSQGLVTQTHCRVIWSKACLTCAHRAAVKASSVQKLETWLIQMTKSTELQSSFLSVNLGSPLHTGLVTLGTFHDLFHLIFVAPQGCRYYYQSHFA